MGERRAGGRGREAQKLHPRFLEATKTEFGLQRQMAARKRIKGSAREEREFLTEVTHSERGTDTVLAWPGMVILILLVLQIMKRKRVRR